MTYDDRADAERRSMELPGPLPPEVPAPRPSGEADDSEVLPPLPPELPHPSDRPDTGESTEWWRSPAEPDAGVPGPRAEGAVPSEADGDGAESGRFWNGEAVRGELKDAWNETSTQAVAAAHEIGSHIGEAIAAHLPDPHAAAAQRGMDIRWMRLKINIPALFLATLVTINGRSPAERMIRTIAADGLFAPLGWVFMFALVIGVLLITPLGGILAPIGQLITSLVNGLVRLLGTAWTKPVSGYVLRVLAATVVWSFIVALIYSAGRWLIYVLTGV